MEILSGMPGLCSSVHPKAWSSFVLSPSPTALAFTVRVILKIHLAAGINVFALKAVGTPLGKTSPDYKISL